jgi:hypothetical protein
VVLVGLSVVLAVGVLGGRGRGSGVGENVSENESQEGVCGVHGGVVGEVTVGEVLWCSLAVLGLVVVLKLRQ